MVLAALQVCPHCQRGAEPMAGGPWAPSPATRETPAAQASLTHPFHTHCIQISGAHSATWICLCHSLHLKAVGLWDIHTGSCRSGGIHDAHAAGIAQALPRCRTHFDIHEKSCFLSSSQCKPTGNFLPEQARLITGVNPLQAAKAGVLTPILAALLQQRWRLSSNTWNDLYWSTKQLSNPAPHPPAPSMTPETPRRRQGRAFQSAGQQRQLSHVPCTRGRAQTALKCKGEPAVLAANKVNTNDISPFRSEGMTRGTCHRRMHGEFTDGQAISIKLSSPPILLWITALKPLNYLNSISLRIFEASCSD